MNIKIIGLGGIGNCVVPILARFLNFDQPDATLTLIDGDVFVEHNQRRQHFDRLGNKAEVTKEWLEGLFPELCFRAEPEFVTRDNLPRLVYNGDIVFLCVDNHASRKMVSDHGENLSDVVILSGGNEVTHGNVQIFIRRNGENITPPLANELHPEIVKPADMHPLAAGCMQMLPETPQVIFANNTAATILLNAFYAYLQGAPMDGEIYFDILGGSVRPANRQQQRRKDLT